MYQDFPLESTSFLGTWRCSDIKLQYNNYFMCPGTLNTGEKVRASLKFKDTGACEDSH